MSSAISRTLSAAAAFVLAHSTAPALERLPRAAPDAHDGWSRGSTCTVAYYNFCTGWIWTWTNWAPGDRVGTWFPSHCAGVGGTIASSWLYVPQAAPPGYGFTGTFGVHSTDALGCPIGTPLATQTFLPVSGWNLFEWYVLTWNRFALVVEFGAAPGSPIGLASDHPAVSPVGGAACGTCYPLSRVTHSYHWGTETAPLCPGVPIFDGFCNAELLLDVEVLPPPYAVEPATWGRLKSLYR